MTTDTASHEATQARSELRVRVAAVCAVCLVGVVISVLAEGLTGLWGALAGMALVLVFFGSSAWVMTRTRPLEPALVLVIALGLYLLKMIGVIVVVVVLGAMDLLGDPFHRVSLALTVIAGALTWSAAEIVTTVRRRQPLFDAPREAS
jgi:hypothetical protein